ncbi:hypothetical protein [Caulobacter sp. LARHSG274]
MALDVGVKIFVTPRGAPPNFGTLGAWVKLKLSKEPAFLSHAHAMNVAAADVRLMTTAGPILGAVLDARDTDAAVVKCSAIQI